MIATNWVSEREIAESVALVIDVAIRLDEAAQRVGIIKGMIQIDRVSAEEREEIAEDAPAALDGAIERRDAIWAELTGLLNVDRWV